MQRRDNVRPGVVGVLPHPLPPRSRRERCAGTERRKAQHHRQPRPGRCGKSPAAPSPRDEGAGPEGEDQPKGQQRHQAAGDRPEILAAQGKARDRRERGAQPETPEQWSRPLPTLDESEGDDRQREQGLADAVDAHECGGTDEDSGEQGESIAALGQSREPSPSRLAHPARVARAGRLGRAGRARCRDGVGPARRQGGARRARPVGLGPHREEPGEQTTPKGHEGQRFGIGRAPRMDDRKAPGEGERRERTPPAAEDHRGEQAEGQQPDRGQPWRHRPHGLKPARPIAQRIDRRRADDELGLDRRLGARADLEERGAGEADPGNAQRCRGCDGRRIDGHDSRTGVGQGNCRLQVRPGVTPREHLGTARR